MLRQAGTTTVPASRIERRPYRVVIEKPALVRSGPGSAAQIRRR
jgi:hypothetical protein